VEQAVDRRLQRCEVLEMLTFGIDHRVQIPGMLFDLTLALRMPGLDLARLPRLLAA